MHIVVRRSGGFAGLTRSWRIDTETCADPGGWTALVGALPPESPAADPAVRDDVTWLVTVAPADPASTTSTTIPGTRLDGVWATLVDRVRDEGDPA